jgi:hypothetical protein
LTVSSEAAACAGIVEDIAALARKLAETEPYKSASGPEALRALAAHLGTMVTRTEPRQTAAVSVAVRARRKRGDR